MSLGPRCAASSTAGCGRRTGRRPPDYQNPPLHPPPGAFAFPGRPNACSGILRRTSRLEPMDREILSLRHFQHLNRAESAQVLGIAEEAAAKRYIRALKRLKNVLADMPGGLEGWRGPGGACG